VLFEYKIISIYLSLTFSSYCKNTRNKKLHYFYQFFVTI